MYAIKPDTLRKIEQEHWLVGLQVSARPLRYAASCLCGWDGRPDEFGKHVVANVRLALDDLVVVVPATPSNSSTTADATQGMRRGVSA